MTLQYCYFSVYILDHLQVITAHTSNTKMGQFASWLIECAVHWLKTRYICWTDQYVDLVCEIVGWVREFVD